MKRNLIYLFFLGCMSAGLWSCEYQLDSENYRAIPRPDTTQTIQVDLSPFQTQYLFTFLTSVSYNLNTFGLKIYNVEFFVDDQSVHTGSEAKGGFVLDPGNWSIGPHKMTMVVTTNSNSGSLADLLQAEGLVFQQSWDVYLDGHQPDPVEITQIAPKDGVLKIDWQEYKRLNFQKYVLYRNFGDVEGPNFAHVIAEITDPTQTSWEDSSFIGGTGIYWLEVDGSGKKATGQKQRVDYPEPALNLQWVNSDSASFGWTKNPFYQAVDHVTLTVPDYYTKPDVTLFSSDNVNDTTCVAKGLRFGNSSQYTLSVYAKTNVPVYQDNQVLRSSVSFGIGHQLVPFSQFVGDPVNKQFYLSDNTKIYRYSYPGMTQQESCTSGFFSDWFVSLYDQKLVTIINSTMTMYPKNDLQNPVSHSNYDFGFNGLWVGVSISSNNRMVGPTGFSAGLYDWNTGKLLFTSDNQELDWCTLSPDGNYLFSRKSLGYADQEEVKIWRVTETAFEAVGSLPNANYSYLRWVPDGGHQLAALKGYQFNMDGVSENHFAVYDAETAQSVADFPVKVGYIAGMAPSGKLLALYSHIPHWDYTEYAYLYNYETGELVKRISLQPQINKLWFYRSHLFSSEGYSIDISEF